jgi:hypothetical protein
MPPSDMKKRLRNINDEGGQNGKRLYTEGGGS